MTRKSPEKTSRCDKYDCLLSGLDSLYVSYFFSAKLSDIDWEDLAVEKERLRSSSCGEGEEIRLGCERFMLQPYGSKPYTYVLRNRHFIVRLAENMNPCCHVQFLSEGLWANGPEKQLNQFDLWAASVGFTPIRKPVISRADWAFDFHIEKIDFNENNFVSLANKDSKHRSDGKAQTFTFGTGEKVVRIYDKTAEINERSGKTFFYQLWGCRENVWRIEFQVRGEGLKEFGIKTPSELFAGQTGILAKLAEKHTSLRNPSNDKNRSRWPLHPLWRSLLDVIKTAPQSVCTDALDMGLPLMLRLREQEKSLYGSLKGIGTLWSILEETEEPLSMDETLKRLATGLQLRHHNRAEWSDDIARRRNRFQMGEW